MKYTACSYLLFLFWTSSFSQYQIKSNINFNPHKDFDALNKVLEVFSTQFSAKFEDEGNVKATKKVAKTKK